MRCKYCGLKYQNWMHHLPKCTNYHNTKSDWYCQSCGSPIPARQFISRKTKSGEDVVCYSHTSLCEFCPPDNNVTKWANTLCDTYPERVVITGKCTCSGVKLRHHPSYKKPFEIELLCRVCHSAAHKKFRSLAEKSAVNSSPLASHAEL